jgi:phthalate 4,5-dioxygenase
MLSKEQNDRLCRVGPGTPMGAVFRQFWLPICTADKVAEPGGRPRAERLLGEDFVVFRAKNGSLGVLDEYCPHRSASLALGRVEDCGIRCLKTAPIGVPGPTRHSLSFCSFDNIEASHQVFHPWRTQ